jgi:DNA gyrase subunit B
LDENPVKDGVPMSINPAEQSMPEPRYTADDIVVLEGLEAVRRRPGMYIGDTRDGSGLHHMVYKVVDNAINESLAGYCDRVIVTLNADGSVTVDDNGRGIPTEIHASEGVSAAEVIMTQLVAGGKFDQNAHTVSGGLHGVRVSVVNALSSRLDLTIWRGGKEHAMTFEHGVPREPLKVVGDALGRSGTRVTFLPSSETFTKTEFDYKTLEHRLRELAFLNACVRIVLKDLRGAEPESEDMHYPEGLKDYVRALQGVRTPLIREPIEAKAECDGVSVEAVFSWNAGAEDVRAYTNCEWQTSGGTHLAGFLAGLMQVLSERAAQSGIASGTITENDTRSGLTGVVSVTMDWPRYGDSMKETLASPEVHPVVQNAVSEAFGAWFETHPNDVKAILQKMVATARKREAGEQLARALQNIV